MADKKETAGKASAEPVDRTDLPVPAGAPGMKEIPLEGTVKYIGKATTRTISKAEWNSVPAQYGGPIDDQEGVTWHFKENQHTLPIDMFSDKALKYLARDGRFKITDYAD